MYVYLPSYPNKLIILSSVYMLQFLETHIRKVVFALFVGMAYWIVAHPRTYKTVGYITGYKEYENINKEDRFILLRVHAFVMVLVVFGLLFLYNPMNVSSRRDSVLYVEKSYKR